MIKAVLFDYGGVMSQAGGGTELSDLFMRELGISHEEALSIITAEWQGLIRGKTSNAEFAELVAKRTGKHLKMGPSFWPQWEQFKPLPEMLQLVHWLKSKGIIVGMISNTTRLSAGMIKSNGGYDLFTPLILSCDVGLIKPELEIYKLALKELGEINPEQVVFVDDQERCLEPARKLGMNTIKAETPAQITNEVKALL